MAALVRRCMGMSWHRAVRGGTACSLRAALPLASRAGFKIYTRTGDAGTSALLTGERRPKYDPCFEAVGTVDELSSALGVTMASIRSEQALQDINEQLQRIQCILQDVSSCLVTPDDDATPEHLRKAVALDEAFVTELEALIDAHEEELAPLKNFILPGGGPASASFHVARTVCRRAERRAVELQQVQAVQPAALKFLNRLSDYLFTLARVACHRQGEEELVYRRATRRRTARVDVNNKPQDA
ncbi:uncharacterized protein MONBRDRAFT_38259 [Monosiga brevicollis MX1]|uniref:Cobalamin adenosyltransferase-like domain-containing protein n=1 Tax=Monosiga brevicollis TaxID=81824 RepID=A9V6S9_MONBE|nr:uncharacterized protein MONBRDRAFT_38259 [Monosiga brevicollis MX1]EDQ86859.1 predicted protein [Monosiga brevicollis MX1]|eukprot:XP_001748404.1 hypothetical protein [Monosiga brevicollis MX1]